MSKRGAAIEWVRWEPGATRTIRGPHSMTRKVLNWSYCAHCGLVALRNEATRQALRRECIREVEA